MISPVVEQASLHGTDLIHFVSPGRLSEDLALTTTFKLDSLESTSRPLFVYDHFLEDGYDIRTIQELRGDANLNTRILEVAGVDISLCPVRKTGRLVVVSRLLPELAKTLDSEAARVVRLDSS